MSSFQVCCKILFPGGDAGEKYKYEDPEPKNHKMLNLKMQRDENEDKGKANKSDQNLDKLEEVSDGIKIVEASLPELVVPPVLSSKMDGNSDQKHLSWDLKSLLSNVPQKPTSIQNFSVLQVIGMGSWGKVVLAVKKDGTRSFKNILEARNEPIKNMLAIKIMKKYDLVRTNLSGHAISERNVMAEIADHPFLITLKYAFQDAWRLYLAMEYCPGGDIFFRLNLGGVFSENHVRFYSSELSVAVQYLHDCSIIYRDMKPENILIDSEGHIKLTDFGLSKTGMTSAVSGAVSMCGTQNYMAPEMISGSGYGFSVDWWGLGILIYEMLQGSPPWCDPQGTPEELFHCIQHSPFIMPSHFSEEVRNLLICLLEKNPLVRLGTNGIEQIQTQDFFSCLDWAEVADRKCIPPLIPGNSISATGLNFDPRYSSLSVNSEENLQQELQEDVSSQSPTAKTMRNAFKDFDYENPNMHKLSK